MYNPYILLSSKDENIIGFLGRLVYLPLDKLFILRIPGLYKVSDSRFPGSTRCKIKGRNIPEAY